MNITSADVVTLDSVSEVRTYGVQNSEQRPVMVNTCVLPVVQKLRLPDLKG